jgi:lipid II:glycine glycyltransferase (peptidoglycan interpeptide bridge formation enzyme)
VTRQKLEPTDQQRHYMQTTAWAEVKAQFGWKHEIVTLNEKDIVVYKRLVPGLGTLLYIPGLMNLATSDVTAFTDLLRAVYARKGFGVRLEMSQVHNTELLESLKTAGWLASRRHVQYRHTVKIDLAPSEKDIWMSFKSRGRYEVLQAQKFEVKAMQVEASDENLEKMYGLMTTTSKRNKFYIRDKKFTFAYWQAFRRLNQLQVWFAYHEDDLLAGAVVLTSGTLAWYKDGGSVRIKSNMMAARLLQWEIIKSLKAQGTTTYDLSGIPAPESHKTSSMHGIYVFKSAFAKESIELMPTLELPLNARFKLWPKAEKQWLRAYNLFAKSLWW